MSGTHAERLEGHKQEHGATDLFEAALDLIEPHFPALRCWTYPLGVWFGLGRQRPGYIGLDVRRDRPGSIAILPFDAAASRFDDPALSPVLSQLNAEPDGGCHPGVHVLIGIDSRDQLDERRDLIVWLTERVNALAPGS